MLAHEQICLWLTLKPHSQHSAVKPDCSVSHLLQGHSPLAGVAPEEHVPGVQQDLSEHFRSGTRPKGNQELLSSQQLTEPQSQGCVSSCSQAGHKDWENTAKLLTGTQAVG